MPIVKALTDIDPFEAVSDQPGPTIESPALAQAREADAFAAALRRVAEMVETTPDLLGVSGFPYAFRRMLIPAGDKAGVAAITRAALHAGATATKRVDTAYAYVDLAFGAGVTLVPFAGRAEMCERVVVGVESYTEVVPDPEALAAVPTITQTGEREIVEWRCGPILDGGAL